MKASFAMFSGLQEQDERNSQEHAKIEKSVKIDFFMRKDLEQDTITHLPFQHAVGGYSLFLGRT